MIDPPIPVPVARMFSHEAMHTTFRLRLCEESASLARDLARECFEQLDLIESRLSRFIDGSDASRINHLLAGETLYISEYCHQCLLIAVDAQARTGGLFDITLGRPIEHRKSGAPGPLPALTGKLTLHPDIPAVTCNEAGREIDLGGIGKGFALDQLHQLLTGWGAPGALLSAGASSLLAFGPQTWPVNLTGNDETVQIALRDEALSASGTGIQGSHIIHPGGEDAMPASPATRIWVGAPTAALAEAWSTALMLLDPAEIADFVAGEHALGRIHADHGGKIRRIV